MVVVFDNEFLVGGAIRRKNLGCWLSSQPGTLETRTQRSRRASSPHCQYYQLVEGSRPSAMGKVHTSGSAKLVRTQGRRPLPQSAGHCTLSRVVLLFTGGLLLM